MSGELVPMTTDFIVLPPPDVPAGMKQCAECLQIKPLAAFPLKGDGLRRPRCGPCHSRRRRAKTRGVVDNVHLRRMKEQIAAMVKQLTSDAPEVPTVAALAHGLTAELGGVDELVRLWADSLKSAKKGSPASLNGFKAYAKLCEVAGGHNRVIEGLRNMSDAELNALLIDTMQDELQSRGLKVVIVDEDDDEDEAAPTEGVA